MAVAERRIDPRRWNDAMASGSDQLRLAYDPERDLFALTLGDPRPAYTHDEGDVSIQVDLDANEVIGLYIYDFERRYLPQHPKVAEWWWQTKPKMTWRAFGDKPLQEPIPQMPTEVSRQMELLPVAG